MITYFHCHVIYQRRHKQVYHNLMISLQPQTNCRRIFVGTHCDKALGSNIDFIFQCHPSVNWMFWAKVMLGRKQRLDLVSNASDGTDRLHISTVEMWTAHFLRATQHWPTTTAGQYTVLLVQCLSPNVPSLGRERLPPWRNMPLLLIQRFIFES